MLVHAEFHLIPPSLLPLDEMLCHACMLLESHDETMTLISWLVDGLVSLDKEETKGVIGERDPPAREVSHTAIVGGHTDIVVPVLQLFKTWHL